MYIYLSVCLCLSGRVFLFVWLFGLFVSRQQCRFDFRCFVFHLTCGIRMKMFTNRPRNLTTDDKRNVWLSVLWHLYEIRCVYVNWTIWTGCPKHTEYCLRKWCVQCVGIYFGIFLRSLTLSFFQSNERVDGWLIINRHRTIFCHYQKWRPNWRAREYAFYSQNQVMCYHKSQAHSILWWRFGRENRLRWICLWIYEVLGLFDSLIHSLVVVACHHLQMSSVRRYDADECKWRWPKTWNFPNKIKIDELMNQSPNIFRKSVFEAFNGKMLST